MQLVFDIETTPIPKNRRQFPERIHCIIAKDVNTGEVLEGGPGDIEAMVAHLVRAKRLIGHDIARFDAPVLQHFYPKLWAQFEGELFDTYACSRLVFASNLYVRSLKHQKRTGIPNELLDSHKLEAWGYRLGKAKQFANVEESFFHEYSGEMVTRCRADVELTDTLYRRLISRGAEDARTIQRRRGDQTVKLDIPAWPVCSERSLLNESQCAYIIGHMERNGVGFNREAAGALYAELCAEQVAVRSELEAQVVPWQVPDGKPTLPKRSCIRTAARPWPVHIAEGAEYQKVKWLTFNPGSPQHRIKVLSERYGWQPKEDEYTECGQPRTDEDVLSNLDYPIVPSLLRFMTLSKRVGQLADGNQGWLKHEIEGRIHGAVWVTGTRTSRAAHFKPNLGQVPKCSSPYGPQCRELFRPTRPGWVQVGVDAKGLELRMAAHYMARYDGGAFAAIVLNGDPHTEFMQATGIFDRDNQKTFIYALLYGAADPRLGLTLLLDWRQAFAKGLTTKKPPSNRHAEALAAVARAALLRKFPALAKVIEKCKEACVKGWLSGLDGRVLACKSEHGALNDLLQSAGSILVKWAMPIWWRNLCAEFGPHGERWALMLWVHDEWQFECEPAIATRLGEIVCAAVREAGEILGVRCRMDGDAKSGSNWRETH